MELDEIKELWTQSNRKLEASTRLNATLVRWHLRMANTELKRLGRGVAFEMLVNVAAVVLLGGFAAAHVREPRFFVPALLLDAYAIALVAAGAAQLAAIAALHYDEPVVTIQKKLEALRIQRIRTTLGTLLFAPLMWMPLLIVGLRGLFGLDVYAAGPAWLAANLVFGLAVIPIALFTAKRYGDRFAKNAALRRLADDVAGRSLARALEQLDALRRFESGAA